MTLKQQISLDYLNNGPFLVRYVKSSINKFYFLTESELHFSFFKIELNDLLEYVNTEHIADCLKSELTPYNILQLEFIIQNESSEDYTVVFFNDKNQAVSLNLRRPHSEEKRTQVELSSQILEMYKNHNFPFNLVFLTADNELFFYSKELVFQCKFSLGEIH